MSLNIFESYLRLHELIINGKITFAKNGLKEIAESYSFLHISENESLNEKNINIITQNIKKSRIIIFDQSEKLTEITNKENLIIGFEKTLIILEKSSTSDFFVYNMLSKNSNIPVCFISNTKFLIDKSNQIKNLEIPMDEDFNEEIQNFHKEFMSNNELLGFITPCMSAYLIKKSYLSQRKYRIEQFIDNIDLKDEIISNNDFVELRLIGFGSLFKCALIYHIKRGQLYVIKKPNGCDGEIPKLIEREKFNYRKLSHPFMPTFYGIVEKENYIIIEFINGKTLDDIKNINLTFKDILNIIFELMLIFKYLYDHQMIYRDLKPNNVMIDSNKEVVLIDLDRLIISDENRYYHSIENNCLNFIAPEINETGKFTYESDIYSLGKIIEYIMKEIKLDTKTIKDIHQSNEYSVINEIILQCTNIKAKNRSSISEIIQYFYSNIQEKVQLEKLFTKYEDHFKSSKAIITTIEKFKSNKNDPKIQYTLCVFYMQGKYTEVNIDKFIYYLSLAADQNYPDAQYFLGSYYYFGNYVERDINKSVHYFYLAANQGESKSQFFLGYMYYEGKYIEFNINKAIHYLSLAANQNIPEANFTLGAIYNEGKYVKHDIDKAIHYFSLAADQNYSKAQYNLGFIYNEGKYVLRDKNKAIHYFSLAASQNHIKALNNLGLIYSDDKYINHDIDKAIHYFSLAADQNNSDAQFNLGFIYDEGKYVFRDINKAIYYYSLASSQNHIEAIYNLGVIYYSGEYIKRDIDKAIYYFTLAANQNDMIAQFDLGGIYFKGIYVKRDINKAIYYYSLAANQNYSKSQFNLGLIYHEGYYVCKDINKAIYYYSLAANQNDYKAQVNLGYLYLKGFYIPHDIDKAIHYFKLAANQNIPEALYNLGLIYEDEKYITRDITKAIYYFSLAANHNCISAQRELGLFYLYGDGVPYDENKGIYYLSLAASYNNPGAQFYLGIFYYDGLFIKQNAKKSLFYLMQASKNKLQLANFAYGFVYHEGKIVKKNINEAIHYYKEASSFNNQWAKNNLGIIYKHGYDNIKGNAANAIEYFEEAIRQNKDYLSMYNLAHILIYDETIKRDLDKSIKLLVKSSENFQHSLILLCLVLTKKRVFGIKGVVNEFEKLSIDENLILVLDILEKIKDLKLHNSSNFELLYEYYRKIDFVYGIHFLPILSSDLEKTNFFEKYSQAVDITNEFYEGFGLQ